MRNKLLITTALVAVSFATNVYAEALPADATNLTAGKYVVEDTGEKITHQGNIKVSEDASLEVNTYVGTDMAQDIVTDYSRVFSVAGDLEIGDATNGGGSLFVKREDNEKPFMFVDGNLTVNDGATVEMLGTDEGGCATINIGRDAEIKGGTVSMTSAEIFVNKDLNISGGEINITDGGLFTEATLSETAKAGNITMSNGSLVLNGEAGFGTEDGDVSISGGTITLNGEETNIEANKLAISGGKIVSKDGYIVSHEDVMISGGEHSFAGGDSVKPYIEGFGTYGSDVAITSLGSAEVSGGTLTLQDASIDALLGFKMSDGIVNLVTSTDSKTSTLWSGGDMNFEGGVVNVEEHGTINTFHKVNGEDKRGNILLSGTVVNVKEDSQLIFGSKGEVVLSDGALNIAQYAGVTVSDKYQEDGRFDTDNVGTLQLVQKGKINLDGHLKANIDGDDRGEIVFGNANAVVKGNVDTPSLTFMSDHSMSEAITGTLGSVDKLTVAKGTLNFDKEMTSTITTVEVASGATLDIGLNTLHSTGDKADGEGVLFKDNSTLKFITTSAEEHGKVLANYVNISENGTTLDMTFNGAALGEEDSMTIRLFDQSEDKEGVEIDGKFAKLQNNARYDFTDNGDGTYTISNTKSVADVVEEVGGNTNNVSTAEAWDSIDTAKVSNNIVIAIVQKLAELSNNVNEAMQKIYKDALTAIAPEVSPMVQQTQSETANQVFGAVGTRLSGGTVGGRQGMSSGDNPFERVAVWVQGLFNKSKLDNTSKSKGFDSDTYGTAFGIEKMLDSHRKVGIGYAYSKTDIDGFMRDTDVKTHTAILYGEYKPSQWYVNGIATYGWSDYDESKNVAGIGVKADYDVETFGLQAMTGYEMNLNGVQLTPEAGLRYVHISQDSYKDSADQKVSGNDSDILTGVIGAKVSKNVELFNGMMLKPEAKVAATYDLLNDKVNSVVTLANGSAYSVSGKSLNRFGMEFGAGLTAEVDDNIELSLGYEGKFRENYQDHTGLINAKYKF